MKISYVIIILLFFILLSSMGYAVSTLPFKITLILIIGFISSILTIMNLEIGLYLFLLVVPFTQQIPLTKGPYGYPAVDIGTDDVLILFILISWLVNLTRRKEPAILKTSLNWPIAAFFAAGVFSFVGAYTRFGISNVLISLLHFVKFFEYVSIYFIVISVVNNFNQIRKFFLMSLITVTFVAVLHLGILITHGHFSFTSPPPAEFQVMYIRIMHAFVSEAVLGTYYCFFLSFLMVILLDTKDFQAKIALILLVALISLVLFNTFSRSAYIGIAASFLILAMLKEKRFFLILLLMVVFSPIYMQSAVLERITLTIQALQPKLLLDESAAVRLTLWRKAFLVFLNNPIFGTGYWTCRWALPGEAHSYYLARLLETGIVGFSIFCWLIIRMFKNAIMLMKKADTDFLKSLGLGYIMGLASILAVCFFSEPLDAFHMLGPLWLMTGLVTSANRLLSEKKEEPAVDST